MESVPFLLQVPQLGISSCDSVSSIRHAPLSEDLLQTTSHLNICGKKEKPVSHGSHTMKFHLKMLREAE